MDARVLVHQPDPRNPLTNIRHRDVVGPLREVANSGIEIYLTTSAARTVADQYVTLVKNDLELAVNDRAFDGSETQVTDELTFRHFNYALSLLKAEQAEYVTVHGGYMPFETEYFWKTPLYAAQVGNDWNLPWPTEGDVPPRFCFVVPAVESLYPDKKPAATEEQTAMFRVLSGAIREVFGSGTHPIISDSTHNFYLSLGGINWFLFSRPDLPETFCQEAAREASHPVDDRVWRNFYSAARILVHPELVK